MPDDTRQPFLQRYSDDWDETLSEEVEDRMWGLFAEWFRSALPVAPNYQNVPCMSTLQLSMLTARTRAPFDVDVLKHDMNPQIVMHDRVVSRLKSLRQGQPLYVFAVADFLIAEYGANSETLEAMLSVTGSGWTASPDRGITKRVLPSAAEAAEAASSHATSASDHLSMAWNAAFGLQPSAPTAYDEAVKAVEAAAKPVVTPNDASTTLGKIIAAVEAKPDKWIHAIASPKSDPVLHVAAMMRMLWEGQHRHGDSETVARNELSDARAAVHLAVTLVQWIESGAFTRYDRSR